MLGDPGEKSLSDVYIYARLVSLQFPSAIGVVLAQRIWGTRHLRSYIPEVENYDGANLPCVFGFQRDYLQ